MNDAQLHPFEAEVGRVLDLVINALYTNRDIFLRELVSNASDACDKLRYEAIARPELLEGGAELAITITADAEARTLTVSDNGIGMGRDELVDNLGTVARSGTAKLKAALEGGDAKKADLSLIGQFGVGFYSAFMVADRVVVTSRKAGEDSAWVWSSNGRDGFAVEEGEARGHGTTVLLHMKEDAQDYLKEHEIRRIVRAYSDHIGIPIRLAGTGEDGPQQINQASALWTRSKSEITDEQYTEFYHHVAHAFDQPWARVHFQAEGRLSYTALLFVPSTRPFDVYDPQAKHGIRLYVRRVFITDKAEGLLPRYLRFVTGVVDSEDLSLNVSRETLQHGAVIATMRKTLVGRVLNEIKRKAKDDAEAYLAFWDQLGPVLKEGLYEDDDHRPELLELARFRSTRGEGWVSLAEYVAAMRPGQDTVYYITGDSLGALRSSPQLEACRAKGVEVLLLTDAVDSFWIGRIGDYAGKKLVSLTQGAVDLSGIEAPEGAADETPEAEPAESGAIDALLGLLRDKLGGDVQDVRVSTRLTDSPVCLVAPDMGMDLRLERLLKESRQLDMATKHILEVNAKHRLITALARQAGDAARADEIAEIGRLLLDQARIVEGEPIPDPAAFAKRMSAALTRQLDAA
ncbi:molecular chaperone HtpG [Marinivivus vitaminiproducens]|uniref:molecular chaperone HtpG n=1 Tax=Marinivivus vitaminiproducens TaxID=3035935 RepID=UPI0027A38D57|nr:molecular chaperone HtpG [Geminicoccaceae bacterium SCSIO 64248]